MSYQSVPPDSHGEFGRYSDLANECKVRCVHDNDECLFTRYCPKYVPSDYDNGDYVVLPIGEHASVSCELAPTGVEFMKKVYGYNCKDEVDLLERIDGGGFAPGHQVSKLSRKGKWMIGLWELLQHYGDIGMVGAFHKLITLEK